MLAFPIMLVSAAQEAGIPVPPDELLDDPDSFKEEFPQFFLLCATQLCRPMHHGEHFENAKALAKIPVEELKTMSVADFEAAGVRCRY